VLDCITLKQYSLNACLAGCTEMPQFPAPEVVQGADYGRAVDMWSTGVLLYLLLSGNLPFYGSRDQLLSSSAYSSYSVRMCSIVLLFNFLMIM